MRRRIGGDGLEESHGALVRMLWTLLALITLHTLSCSKETPQNDAREVSGPLQAGDWPLETLVATNSIHFEDRATFTGNVAVTKKATGAVLSSNAELTVGSDAILTGNAQADTLVLGDGASITGNARYNSISNAGQVGSTSSPLTLPLSIAIPSLPTITPGTQDVVLTNSQQTNLAAGTYRDVVLNNGNGGIATKLTLTGGLYQLKSLTLQNDARLECQAACEIRIKGRVAVGDRSFLGPKGGIAGLGAGNVEVLVAGTNATPGPSGTPASATINNDAEFQAYLLAPAGTVRLGHRVEFRGKVVARDALVGFDNDAQGRQLPLIGQQPQSITVREGESASFSVGVTVPTTGITYRWQRDGVDVQGPAGSGSTYTLAHADGQSDGARFRVRVSTDAGSVYSDEAILTVIPCVDTDVTCDDFDDDCDGVKDEDFGPRCPIVDEPGPVVLTCVGGQINVTPCTNGNVCDGAEVCLQGACQPGTPPDLDDGNPCTADSCSIGLGIRHDILPSGTDCGDENDCNGFDTCNPEGQCVHVDAVVSDDPCLVSTCDPATGWALEPSPFGTHCTTTTSLIEICDGAGNCLPESVATDDGNPCTADSIGPNATPIHTPVAFGTPCQTPDAPDTEICNEVGDCVLKEIARSGTRPGRLRGGYGRAPAHRRTGSRAFRSLGFTEAAESGDLVPDTGNVTSYVPLDVEKRVLLHLTSFDDHIDDCPLGSLQVKARVFINGVAQPDVLIHDQNCDLFGCQPTVPVRFGFGDYVFPPEVDAVSISVQVLEERSFSCSAGNSSFTMGPIVVPLGGLEPFQTQPECDVGHHVDEFCWSAEFDPQLPVPPDPEICFEWGTYFVDDGLGETEAGMPVPCTSDAQCASEMCDSSTGSCTMEQRYPARFAEVQLAITSTTGVQKIGRHYDAAGNPGEGDVLYLNSEGCLPGGTVPGGILSPIAGQGEISLGVGGPTITARVRSRLRHNAAENTGYDIVYANLDPTSPDDDETYDVVEASISGLTSLLSAGFILSDEVPGSESGTRMFVPPSRITLRAGTLVPGSNVAAALGLMLNTADPTYADQTLQVRLGDGFETCPAFGSCVVDSDCVGPQRCQSGTCRHCFLDSNFDPVDRILHIGPSNPEANAPQCTTTSDCVMPLNCLQRSGAECLDGAECYCTGPDQSAWKFVVGHEAGHQLQNRFIGDLANPYEFNGGPDPAGSQAMCSCSHVDSANQLHCLQSAELFSSAFEEGFGHFMAAKAFNARNAPTCRFNYFKEVLAPSIVPTIAPGYCEARPERCVVNPVDPRFNIAEPPVPIDCGAPFRYRNNFCGTLPAGGEDIRQLTNEHDFLQFFYAVYTQGARIDTRDIYALTRTACSSRTEACTNPGDPSTCTPCDNGLCTGDPCTDVSNPNSCGARKCVSGDGFTLPDNLRWAPLLPTEIDDDTSDNVSPETVSLVDGTRSYLTQRYGLDSDQARDFELRGTQHGITPDLSP